MLETLVRFGRCGFAITFVAAFLPPTGSAAEDPHLLRGAAGRLGSGTSFAWVRTDDAGAACEVGISFDRPALDGLGTSKSKTTLPIPAVANLPFRNVVVDWEPHGHPPTGVYDLPHFDVHFYTIDETARAAIVGGEGAASTKPSADLVPPNFVTSGTTTAAMGMHFISSEQPEFHGGRFTATPIYGYANGHLAFIEVMVAHGTLRSRPAIDGALTQPHSFETPGSYPTHWSVTFDPHTQLYTIMLSGLTNHAGNDSDAYSPAGSLHDAQAVGACRLLPS